MNSLFNQKKATEASVYLLSKADDSTLYLLHLLKMLYIAERRALQTWGRSITWDKFISMDHGPVLSQTLNLMNGGCPGSFWEAHISDRDDHKIKVEKNLEITELSRAELKLLDAVFEEFSSVDRFELCNFTHTFPEWEDPRGSAKPIKIRRILEAGDWDEGDIEAVLQEHESLQSFPSVA